MSTRMSCIMRSIRGSLLLMACACIIRKQVQRMRRPFCSYTASRHRISCGVKCCCRLRKVVCELSRLTSSASVFPISRKRMSTRLTRRRGWLSGWWIIWALRARRWSEVLTAALSQRRVRSITGSASNDSCWLMRSLTITPGVGLCCASRHCH